MAEIFDASNFCLVFYAVILSATAIFQIELVVHLLSFLFKFICFFKQFFLQALQNLQLDIVIFILVTISALTDAYVFCYCGATTTMLFSEYADRLYEINSYDLPVPLQKQFVIILANLQRPVYYEGFGMVKLDLELFLNVKLIYVYRYIILKFDLLIFLFSFL